MNNNISFISEINSLMLFTYYTLLPNRTFFHLVKTMYDKKNVFYLKSISSLLIICINLLTVCIFKVNSIMHASDNITCNAVNNGKYKSGSSYFVPVGKSTFGII